MGTNACSTPALLNATSSRPYLARVCSTSCLTSSSATPSPLMTAEEFIKLHGDESGVELVKGRVVRYPMPGAERGEVCLSAGAIIREFVKQAGLGRVMSNDTFVRVGTNPDTYRGADV